MMIQTFELESAQGSLSSGSRNYPLWLPCPLAAPPGQLCVQWFVLSSVAGLE